MTVGCVILAAGMGQRMGVQNKALLSWKGETFLECIARSCREIGARECVVVVAPPHAERTETLASTMGLACVRNPRPEMGMASSVAVGFDHAMRNFASEVCLLWPVDAPGVELSTLMALSAPANAGNIVTPRFAGRGGHPSIVGRDVWSELADCTDEAEGARSVFRRPSSRRAFVDVHDAAVGHDVDTPSDLEKLSC
ncbi:MAG: nucleotidyltransferase family protein [Myxococcales bacterium]|nr:nucleotidyltransferase family protein [Myxococcales bacterium]